MSSEGWMMLADWGTGTSSIDPSQRQLALRIGRALQRGSTIKPTDAERGVEILDRARELGFAVEAEGMDSAPES